MSSLNVKRRLADPEVHRRINVLHVYDARADRELKVNSVLGSAALQTRTPEFGQGMLNVFSDNGAHRNVPGKGRLRVNFANDDNHITYRRQVLRVLSTEIPDALFVKAADANPLEIKAGEKIDLTGIELDLAVSYDTFFDFNLRSVDGIRIVLDGDGKAVQTSFDSYRLNDLSPGAETKRTVLTNNDFKVTLNIRPTIVKSTQ